MPSLLAAFWVVLAGFSGTYLYRIVTGDVVQGSEIDHVGAILNDAQPDALSPEQASALLKIAEVQRKELTTLKSALRDLSQDVAELSKQNAALSSRLKPIEKIFAAPASGGAVTTSPPAPPAIAALSARQPTEPPKPNAPKQEEKPEQHAAAQPETPAPPPDPKPVTSRLPAEPPAAEVAAPDEPAAAEEPKSEERTAAQALAADAAGNTPPPPAASTDPADVVVEEEEVEVAVVKPALDLPPGTTRFGVELGIVANQDALRTLWREMLTNHAALVAGLQARRVLAPDKKWRLIAGPFASAEEANQACVLFKRADRSCEATVFAGDAL